MRKLVTAAFVTLDGVMQAPGGPDEDPSGGFAHGGWVAGLMDETIGAALSATFSVPFDLLLGRRTYDIFAAYWPFQTDTGAGGDIDQLNSDIAEKFNSATKYVATHRPESLGWQNSRPLGTDVVSALRKLKSEDGPMLLTQGSSELIQTLLKHDLIDELRLITFPITLGPGKRLFGTGTQPAAFRLGRSIVSPNGVLIANYERAGSVRTGSLAMQEPSQAELERRKELRKSA